MNRQNSRREKHFFAPDEGVFILDDHIAKIRKSGKLDDIRQKWKSVAIQALNAALSNNDLSGARLANAWRGVSNNLLETMPCSLQRHSNIKWLYHLRQLLFTSLSDWSDVRNREALHICDICTSHAPTSAHPEISWKHGLSFRVNRIMAEDLVELFYFADNYAHIAAYRRLAEKEFEFSKSDADWPRLLQNRPLANIALSHFNRRNRLWQTPFLGLGTTWELVDLINAPPNSCLAITPTPVQPLSATITPPGLTVHGHTPAMFAPVVLTLDQIEQLNNLYMNETRWWQDNVVLDVMMLQIAYWLIVGTHFGEVQLYQQGYISLRTSRFLDWMGPRYHEILAHVLRTFPRSDLPDSLESVLRVLVNRKSNIAELDYGPTVRLTEHHIIFDLLGASYSLQRRLTIPKNNQVAKDWRSKDFEHAVQRAIDETLWSPTAFRPLIGRALRLSGKDITDVDALAVRGKLVLIVECKSFVYTTDYAIGKHSAVRNYSDRVVEYRRTLNRKIDTLRENPCGDNYDFRGHEIHGVVCTSCPIYCEEPDVCREELPGLQCVVVPRELVDWLFNVRFQAYSMNSTLQVHDLRDASIVWT